MHPIPLKEIPGGVCAAKGFRAGGVHCGIKPGSGKRDLGLISADRLCPSAAVFTRNRVKAASVLVSREHIADGRIQAVIANSGNANACTGPGGLAAARRMAELAAGELALEPRQVIVASTGVIGAPLRIGAIEKGIGALAASLRGDEAGSEAFLEAIMTTDTRKKTGALEFDLEGRPIRIGAVVKGSGMIHPNMGTMLCFITTDIAIEQPLLNEILQGVVNRSFNRLTVDGDTSTNDMALVMASGLAGNRPLRSREEAGAFEEALLHLCVKLVRDMARDGEGATKLITVTVRGAGDEEEAAILAKSVAGSSLVKAACFGADANWGRVLCALGYGGVPFDPEKCAVQFAGAPGEIPVFQKGLPLPFDEGAARDLLSGEEIEIRVQVGTGPGEAQAWGCDLSYEYVKINGDYRS